MTTPAQPAAATALEQTALALAAGGLSLLPVDGSDKRPYSALLPRYCPWPRDDSVDNERGKPTWKTFQQVRAPAALISEWVRAGAQIAVACGAISGGLEIEDVDEASFYPALMQAIGPISAGLPVQQTGGGGYQIAYRCPAPGHNDKLAYVPDASKFDGRRIAIETRGEGGYAILYPSLHPSGQHYALLQGDFAKIPYISQAQRDQIIAAARSLCQAPYTTLQLQAMQQAMSNPSPSRQHANGSANIIDQYNASTSIEDELRRQGYTHCYGERWAPPGAGKRDSVLASKGRAFHFDTNYPLADDKAHDAFDLFCYYEHRGDVKSAIKAAATLLCIPQQGPVPPAPGPVSPPPPAPPPVGNGYQPGHPDPVLIESSNTDAGNAACFIALHGDQLRYCRSKKEWLCWDGQRWRWDGNSQAFRLMLGTIYERRHAAAYIVDKDKANALFKWTYTSEATARIHAALQSAQNAIEVDTTILDYDQHPMLLATPSGTLELATQTLQSAVPADLITRQIGTSYDPQADAPRWRQFVKEIFDNDQTLIDYMQRAFGYSLTGLTGERKFFLCFGDGYNGKSVLLDILNKLLGDYATTAGFATFDADSKSEATNDLAALKGRHAIVISETNQDRRLNEALIKRLTGKEDEITCRFLRQEFFTYKPTFKIWIAMNHKPRITGTDKGIWSRVNVIPFTQDFEKTDNKNLTDQLIAELPGILNWALTGLAAWQQQGLNPPPVVLQHVQEYRKESDLLGQFLEEFLVNDPTGEIVASEAYQLYHTNARNNGENWPMKANIFGRSLVQRGYTTTRKVIDARLQTVYRGLRLRTAYDP